MSADVLGLHRDTDQVRRCVSKGWTWFDGQRRFWETTFTALGWNGLGERVGYERWFWNGSAECLREVYVAEPARAKEVER
jgi:hypothetical protein